MNQPTRTAVRVGHRVLCTAPCKFVPVPSGIQGVSYYSRCTVCTATEWESNRPDEFRARVERDDPIILPPLP